MDTRKLSEAIQATLAYFDVFDYPLTAVETHKFLWRQRATLGEVLAALAAAEAGGQIVRRLGYYCLPGRETLVATRQQRYLIAERKYRMALRATRWLRLVPNVLLVAVCNNLANSNAREESDVDLFIIARQRRLWLTRLLVTTLMQVLRLRRHHRQIIDRCCLSFYLADDHLGIADLALPADDPYLCLWLATLAPLYNRGTTFERFWSANQWLVHWLPQARPRHLSLRRRVVAWWRPKPAGRAGGWLERLAKRLQQAKLAQWERQRTSATGVVVSDSVLKLHVVDRRDRLRQEWQERLNEFLPP